MKEVKAGIKITMSVFHCNW